MIAAEGRPVLGNRSSPSIEGDARNGAQYGRGAPTLTVRLLDGFELRRDETAIPLPLASQRVVAFLALHGRPLTRLHVAGSLWLDASEKRSCGNLRSALWRIRRCGVALVDATATHVALARHVVVDVRELEDVTHRALASAPGGEEDLGDGCASGELLPDWYDDWLEPERDRLRQLRLHALEAVAERLLESGRTPYAIDTLLVAMRDDPLRESLHRLLIRAHLAEGNATEAVRCYRTYRGRLNAALGIPPSARMEAVVGRLGAVVTQS
jgi:DNA-binding SARP family transcriptional activator